jgi:hypothetical protein
MTAPPNPTPAPTIIRRGRRDDPFELRLPIAMLKSSDTASDTAAFLTIH